MKKFYITTSIAYTNAPPHIGFALELIQADAMARYNRLLKKDVFFLTGTDEHGVKIAKAAEEAGKEPIQFVNGLAEKFANLTKVLNISNDDFIRTSDRKKHWPAVSKVWSELSKRGDIYKKYYQGLYCSGCEAFITKKDLINGKCAIHQKAPEKIEEENYFFKLSRYSKKIQKAVEKDKIKIIPEARKKEMLNFVKQGLEDISFSRPSKDLKWGIPVPGDSSQTIYVWADALSNYLSAIGYESDRAKFNRYWPADAHFIGKDIQKFHIAIWPGMLLSLGLPLPKNIFVHGFITSAGKKMSKSLGNVVDPFELIKKYRADALRYFLLAEIPAAEDGDFTIKRFEQRYNSDLASGIGNLVSRVRAMAEKKLQIQNSESQINSKSKIQNPKLREQIKATQKKYKKTLEEFKFNESLKAVWELIAFCDTYINEERPWDNQTEKQKKKNEKVLNDLLLALEEIAGLLSPFMPETAEKIKNKTSGALFPRLLT